MTGGANQALELMRLHVNGHERDVQSGITVAGLLEILSVQGKHVAVECNREIVPRGKHDSTILREGDRVELVTAVGGGSADDEAGATPGDDPLTIADHPFHSRLIVGTGKYANLDQMRAAIAASGAEIVTVALRRLDLDKDGPALLGALPKHVTLLPNTAGCYTADEAVRTARLARELGMGDWVKLEVIGDEKTLFPDVTATIEAARTLVGEGFVVLPYVTDDVVACKRLEEIGCPAVMPLAAPIGSGLGIRNPTNIQIIVEQVAVSVIVDAGVGTASDAAVAMELGCDAVLMNTAIAGARDPVLMAQAMREAVSAGRKAFLAGRIAKKLYANASSPTTGLIE